jgi:hypothetical protein
VRVEHADRARHDDARASGEIDAREGVGVDRAGDLHAKQIDRRCAGVHQLDELQIV